MLIFIKEYAGILAKLDITEIYIYFFSWMVADKFLFPVPDFRLQVVVPATGGTDFMSKPEIKE